MSDHPIALVSALRDRYAVERELGRGGRATVYMARDLKDDRQVALKVLHSELAAAWGTERFLAEDVSRRRRNGVPRGHIPPRYVTFQ